MKIIFIELSGDIKQILMRLELSYIVQGKTKFSISDLYFLNMDISVNIAYRSFKF